MSFPISRPRRLRHSDAMRRLVRETSCSVNHLIAPIFICDGTGVKREIKSMPGVFQFSIDQAVEEAKQIHQLRIPAVILFGVPDRSRKDACGSEAWAEDGLVQRALRAIRNEVPDLMLIADACFCEYTDHGHCGVLNAAREVENDPTLDNLARSAVAQAAAGADIIAPSGMMDGMVRAIRAGLDAAGFTQTAIMAYSVKYASAFYGPFRDAADSAPAFGDRRQYQMDCHNKREGRREALLDVEEGADIIMVKPALAYLDVIADVRQNVDLPVCAYNVSGEYSMVKAAAQNGWIDEKRTVLEIVASIRRAGADMIITYWAKDLAQWLSE
ncbi:MAG: porphobilinogen synthase [Planctomycetota bacterium]